jgi:hypothetical protein
MFVSTVVRCVVLPFKLILTLFSLQNLIMRHKKAARIQSLFKGYRFRNEIRMSR